MPENMRKEIEALKTRELLLLGKLITFSSSTTSHFWMFHPKASKLIDELREVRTRLEQLQQEK